MQIRVSTQTRVSYNLRRTQVRLHRNLDVCVVVASALVVIVLGAVGGALQFLLAVLSEDVDYGFRSIYFQYSVFEKMKNVMANLSYGTTLLFSGTSPVAAIVAIVVGSLRCALASLLAGFEVYSELFRFNAGFVIKNHKNAW